MGGFSACPGKGWRFREWDLQIDPGIVATDNTTALSSYRAGGGPYPLSDTLQYRVIGPFHEREITVRCPIQPSEDK